MLINDLRSDVFSSYLFALAGCLDQRSAGRGATADLAAGICQRPARRACDIALDRPGIAQNDAIVPDGCEVAIDRPGRAARAGSGAARPHIRVALGVARGGRSILIGIICSNLSEERRVGEECVSECSTWWW